MRLAVAQALEWARLVTYLVLLSNSKNAERCCTAATHGPMVGRKGTMCRCSLNPMPWSALRLTAGAPPRREAAVQGTNEAIKVALFGFSHPDFLLQSADPMQFTGFEPFRQPRAGLSEMLGNDCPLVRKHPAEVRGLQGIRDSRRRVADENIRAVHRKEGISQRLLMRLECPGLREGHLAAGRPTKVLRLGAAIRE